MTYEDILKQREETINALHKEDIAIEKLEAKIEWHKKRRNKINVGSIDTILIPLATEICKRKGFKHFDIYGPFGLTWETSVYFSNVAHEETNNLYTRIDICNVDTWGLQLKPSNDQSGYKYWTGATTNKYAKDTIGDLNGMNNVYAPLPADIDKVIELLKFSEGRPR